MYKCTVYNGICFFFLCLPLLFIHPELAQSCLLCGAFTNFPQFPHTTLCSGTSCSHIYRSGSATCRYILQRRKAEVVAHRSLYCSHPAQFLECSKCSVNNCFQKQVKIIEVSYYFQNSCQRIFPSSLFLKNLLVFLFNDHFYQVSAIIYC